MHKKGQHRGWPLDTQTKMLPQSTSPYRTYPHWVVLITRELGAKWSRSQLLSIRHTAEATQHIEAFNTSLGQILCFFFNDDLSYQFRSFDSIFKTHRRVIPADSSSRPAEKRTPVDNRSAYLRQPTKINKNEYNRQRPTKENNL